MKQATRRPWLQFSVRSLLILMLAVGCFFAGRMSQRHEVERARKMELEAQRAHAAAQAAVDEALMARAEALYQANIAQAQTQLREALLEQAKEYAPAAESESDQ
jgi:hypothetical protein